MSETAGAVRFNDGTIMYCEYSGTSDIMVPKLYDTCEKMNENWRNHPWPIEGECEHQLEDIEIFSTYGGGFYWQGKACRKCNFIIEHLEPSSSWQEEIYYYNCKPLPEDFQKWSFQDGYPSWSPWKY